MSRIGWTVLIGLVLFGVLVLGASLFVPFMMGRGYYPGGYIGPGMMGRAGFPFWGGGLVMLLFWILVIVGGVLIFRSLAPGSGQSTSNVPNRETPLDILKARYARGEINKEQFEAMKRDLGA